MGRALKWVPQWKAIGEFQAGWGDEIRFLKVSLWLSCGGWVGGGRRVASTGPMMRNYRGRPGGMTALFCSAAPVVTIE